MGVGAVHAFQGGAMWDNGKRCGSTADGLGVSVKMLHPA